MNDEEYGRGLVSEPRSMTYSWSCMHCGSKFTTEIPLSVTEIIGRVGLGNFMGDCDLAHRKFCPRWNQDTGVAYHRARREEERKQ